ncbi:MAG: RdgB/HAM1 family non-canonical purine NTP pyrophosphatase [Chlamydiia bacterium]|nr:RdgB/HAM1 family non-canonical purine NTP pyrophosphatase [Chlamydiia bacterium]
MKLFIATANTHKIREIKNLLRDLSYIELFTPAFFPAYTPLKEMGATFEENAMIKATHAAKITHMLSIGDDSGLIVPALGNQPGIFSARFAGPNATEKENRAKLLNEMAHLKDHERSAYFECAMALASPGGLIKCVKGCSEGLILEEERGGNGFGYDSLFLKYDYNKTFAELEESIKNQVSHRGKAMEKLRLILEGLPDSVKKEDIS